MTSWLPVVLVIVVGAIVVAIHVGAMRWLTRQSGPLVTDDRSRTGEKR